MSESDVPAAPEMSVAGSAISLPPPKQLLAEIAQFAETIAPKGFQLNERRLADSLESTEGADVELTEVSDSDTTAGIINPDWVNAVEVEAPPLDEDGGQ